MFYSFGLVKCAKNKLLPIMCNMIKELQPGIVHSFISQEYSCLSPLAANLQQNDYVFKAIAGDSCLV